MMLSGLGDFTERRVEESPTEMRRDLSLFLHLSFESMLATSTMVVDSLQPTSRLQPVARSNPRLDLQDAITAGCYQRKGYLRRAKPQPACVSVGTSGVLL
jgi:hypothetical protein